MTAFNFPDSPAEGELFSPAPGLVYQWYAPCWRARRSQESTAFVLISDTAPGPALSGQLWWESDTGALYVWYQDVDSGQWVQIAAPSTPVPAFVVITDGTAAPAATAGSAKIYVDQADGDLKVRFGDGTVKTIVVDT